MKLPLSVVVIASNEEDVISRCLGSVVDLAAEIIVVENDSTDNTCALASSFGARIYHEAWHGFSIQKNLAIGYATQPWILCLDADEQLDGTLKQSIQKFILADNPRYAGAYFSRRTFFMGRWIKHGDWSPDYVVRLFRADFGRWSGDPVHERLIVDGELTHLRGHVLHYSYRSIREHMHKNLRYAELGAPSKKHGNLCIILRAFWKFFRGYFLKLGFLDGFAGFYIAYMQGVFTLYKHTLQEKIGYHA